VIGIQCAEGGTPLVHREIQPPERSYIVQVLIYVIDLVN